MKVTPFSILLLVLVCSINTLAQHERYVPKTDQASKDPSFKEFGDSLVKIVVSKDSESLMAILTQDIKLSVGGKKGIENFKKIWKPNEPKSRFWKELSTILINGGTFNTESEQKIFCAPYLPTNIFTTFPEEPKIFTYHAIFGKDVKLREQPNLSSKIIASLSYNLVTTNSVKLKKYKKRGEENAWIKVKTVGGLEGFVKARFVRCSVDYRACFEKRNGSWKITALFAGD